jgi:hypothetical protein
MKKRAIWMLVPAVVLGLGACGKKEEAAKAPAAPSPVEAPAQPEPEAPAPVVEAPALSVEERAAKLGFAKYLPQDTEAVISFHNGTKAASRVKGSRIWKLVEEQMGIEGLEDAVEDDDKPADPAEPAGPAALFGTEFTAALGKSTGEQTANLATANRRMGYFQMRSLSKAFAAAAKSGDFSNMQEALEELQGEQLFKDLLADSESGVALIEKMKMPPLCIAFKAGGEKTAGASQQLAALVENLGMLGEMVEPVEVEKAGQKFAGHKISGAKLSEQMAEDREGIEETLDAAVVDKLLAAIAKKDLVVLSGTLGDYAVLFIGGSADDLSFATDTASSLVASDALAFSDAYVTKELAAVIYSQKESMDRIIAAAGGMSDMVGGLRDGLAGAEGLGDTRDIEALLGMVAERETALRKLAGNDTLGMVAFFEDGLKIESIGGTDSGALDWKSPCKLAPLGDSDDVVMFANMASGAAYDENMSALLEALMETSYAIAMKVSEAPIKDAEMAQFRDMAKMFDSKFRPDLVAMWDAFNGDFGSGLGNEMAFVVDLNGTVPAIPGIPQAVVDEGKFPRISMVAPVTDRAKIAGSWDKMNGGITSILKSVSELTGQEFPMQKPTSLGQDGFTTWFFQMPFFNDDFMPSVTVGDQWFAASTSKTQALDLVGKAAKGGETRNGLYFVMNFNSLRKFSGEMLKVVEKNSAAITGEEMTPEQSETTAKVIEAMEDLDKLTVHSRREAGTLRTSVHFKTR